MLNDQQKLVDYVNDDLLGNGRYSKRRWTPRNVLDGWETNGVDVRAWSGRG